MFTSASPLRQVYCGTIQTIKDENASGLGPAKQETTERDKAEDKSPLDLQKCLILNCLRSQNIFDEKICEAFDT